MKTATRHPNCLACNKPLSAHLKWTAEDIEASKAATCEKPINGIRCPISPSCIGKYRGHDPVMQK